MTKGDIFSIIVSLVFVCLTAWLSHSYALQFISPETKAAARHSSTSRPPYLTKKERAEYKEYLMAQEDETNFMLWGEWKLSKVFKKTLTQLEKEQKLKPLGPIAQRLEQTTHNRLVGGSNPSRPTISQK